MLFYFFTSSPLKLVLSTITFLGSSRNEELIFIYQKVLFDPGDTFNKPLNKYELFFSLLDLSCLDLSKQVELKPISRATLARALILKNLKSIKTLSDLAIELYEKPKLAGIRIS